MGIFRKVDGSGTEYKVDCIKTDPLAIVKTDADGPARPDGSKVSRYCRQVLQVVLGSFPLNA